MAQTTHGLQHANSMNSNGNNFKALSYVRYDTVKGETINKQRLMIETDKNFVNSVFDLTKLKSSVLDEIIALKDNRLSDADCDQIHFRGRRHCQANILNTNSGKNKDNVRNQASLRSLLCKCGCESLRGEHFPMGCDLETLKILGPGIILYFYLLKALAIALFFFISIFAIFAVATNLLGTTPITTNSLRSACTSSYCSFRDNASDNYKANQSYLGLIQVWLGLAAMGLWAVTSRVVRYIGNIKNQEIDEGLTSSADFALMIDNLPYGEYNQEELLQYFHKLSEQQSGQEQAQGSKQASQLAFQVKDPLRDTIKIVGDFIADKVPDNQASGIKAIQIIYNMEFSRKMIDKITGLALSVKSLLKEKNGKYIIENKDQYSIYKSDLIDTYEVFEDLRKKFLNDSKFRKALSTRVAIIEFHEQKRRQIFEDNYGSENHKMSFLKRLQAKIFEKCFGQHNAIVFKGSIPEIRRAPEPSDVIWENCEKKENFCRLVVIYLATFLLIMISLGIMVGLEYGQSVLAPSPAKANASGTTTTATNENEQASTLVNIIVSIVMQIINALLWKSLATLLELEYNHTFTQKILSQMNKSLTAMLINIIVLPIIVNYAINNRYYGADGLGGIVFDYHISTITVGLTIKLLDPVSLLIKLGTSIKCIRNYLIKARYRNNHNEEQTQVGEEDMRNVYRLYEAPEFNIAEAYTYILSNILHAAFFCELQPFILLLALVEAITFYWVCKFKVLKWCRMPKMTDKQIFEGALSMFMLVPVFYGVGSIFNSYIASRVEPSRTFSFIPAAICIGIGLLNYFNPKNSIQNFIEFVVDHSCCFQKKEKKKKDHFEGDEQQKQKQEQKKEKEKNVRKENYYKSSNSLTLLGFENLLLGKQKMSEISQELEIYCKSHLRTGEEKDQNNAIEGSDRQLDKDTNLKEIMDEANLHF